MSCPELGRKDISIWRMRAEFLDITSSGLFDNPLLGDDLRPLNSLSLLLYLLSVFFVSFRGHDVEHFVVPFDHFLVPFCPLYFLNSTLFPFASRRTVSALSLPFHFRTPRPFLHRSFVHVECPGHVLLEKSLLRSSCGFRHIRVGIKVRA
jgi:hypothetical protein